MMRGAQTLAGLLAAVALAVSGQALAHARLTASDPAADAQVAAPKQLTLHFSETLQPRFCGLDLIQANGATVVLKASVGKDRKTLTAVPAKPLTPGAYKVRWHAVTVDTHRMEGGYSFTVQ